MGVGLRLSQSRGLVSIPVTPGTRVRAVPSSRPAQTPTATLARTGPRPARERWGTGPGFTRRLRVFRLGHSEGKSGPQFPRAPSGRGMGQCGRSPQTGTTAATTFTAAAARPGAKGDQLSEKGGRLPRRDPKRPWRSADGEHSDGEVLASGPSWPASVRPAPLRAVTRSALSLVLGLCPPESAFQRLYEFHGLTVPRRSLRRSRRPTAVTVPGRARRWHEFPLPPFWGPSPPRRRRRAVPLLEAPGGLSCLIGSWGPGRLPHVCRCAASPCVSVPGPQLVRTPVAA